MTHDPTIKVPLVQLITHPNTVFSVNHRAIDSQREREIERERKSDG